MRENTEKKEQKQGQKKLERRNKGRRIRWIGSKMK
jgi:hypothetical protein